MQFKQYPSYKNSGVEWLGDVPDEWDIYPFWYLFNRKEITNKTQEQLLSVYLDRGVILHSEGGGMVHKPADNLEKYQLVEVNDFVMNNQQAWRGSVGVSPYRGIVSPAYLIFSFNKTLCEPKFFKYFLRDKGVVDQFMIASMSVGTIQRQVKGHLLKTIQLSIPSLIEQNTIANFLDTETTRIDNLIAKQEKLIELLEEQRKSIISHAVTKGLNPDAPMKDSGVEWLGDVPEHWDVKSYRFVSKIYRGKFGHRPRNDPSLYDGEYPFIQTGDVARAGKYIQTYSQTLNEKGKAVSQVFTSGTLVMAIAANIGDTAILNFEAYAPDSVVGFKPHKNIDLEFLRFSFIASLQALEQTAVQSTQANLNVERIGALKTTFPPLSEQIEISNYLNAENEKNNHLISKQNQLIEKLKEYRASIISHAVTGKIDVREFVA